MSKPKHNIKCECGKYAEYGIECPTEVYEITFEGDFKLLETQAPDQCVPLCKECAEEQHYI